MDGSGRVVEVVPYDPSWPSQFEAERQRLLGVLRIEHIGSTSVAGMAAKPILDIMAVVPVTGRIAAEVAGLERLGYVFRPLAFADDEDHLFLVRDTGGRRTHHLHVFGVASPWPRANRVFREYLATHPDAARRYAAAKRRAAEAHPDSRARYAEAKEAVMRQVVDEARRWDSSRGM